MGCSPGKADKKGPVDTSPCGPVEAKVRSHKDVTLVKDKGQAYYALNQTFAIVRHGDRLDHTPEWKTFPDAKHWPNDTPLTAAGHQHATDVGKMLKKSGKPFELIVCSPYYRCAQTASRIAQVLKIPIHFDLDIGEVFDDVSMVGNISGKPQYREPKILEEQLKKDFTDVNWIRDENGLIKIEGKLQKYPEDFDAARMRYCYKVKKLIQKAASELMSIVIVTHGDALAAVVGLLREDWEIGKVPYTAYGMCSRKAKVLEKDSETILEHEPVYVHPDEWSITLSPGFDTKKVTDRYKKIRAHDQHDREMKEMNAQADVIKTDYLLDDEQVEKFKGALEHLGAHDGDITHLLQKAGTSNHLAVDRKHRAVCAPHSQTT